MFDGHAKLKASFPEQMTFPLSFLDQPFLLVLRCPGLPEFSSHPRHHVEASRLFDFILSNTRIDRGFSLCPWVQSEGSLPASLGPPALLAALYLPPRPAPVHSSRLSARRGKGRSHFERVLFVKPFVDTIVQRGTERESGSGLRPSAERGTPEPAGAKFSDWSP